MKAMSPIVMISRRPAIVPMVTGNTTELSAGLMLVVVISLAIVDVMPSSVVVVAAFVDVVTAVVVVVAAAVDVVFGVPKVLLQKQAFTLCKSLDHSCSHVINPPLILCRYIALSMRGDSKFHQIPMHLSYTEQCILEA